MIDRGNFFDNSGILVFIAKIFNNYLQILISKLFNNYKVKTYNILYTQFNRHEEKYRK